MSPIPSYKEFQRSLDAWILVFDCAAIKTLSLLKKIKPQRVSIHTVNDALEKVFRKTIRETYLQSLPYNNIPLSIVYITAFSFRWGRLTQLFPHVIPSSWIHELYRLFLSFFEFYKEKNSHSLDEINRMTQKAISVLQIVADRLLLPFLLFVKGMIGQLPNNFLQPLTSYFRRLDRKFLKYRGAVLGEITSKLGDVLHPESQFIKNVKGKINNLSVLDVLRTITTSAAHAAEERAKREIYKERVINSKTVSLNSLWIERKKHRGLFDVSPIDPLTDIFKKEEEQLLEQQIEKVLMKKGARKNHINNATKIVRLIRQGDYKTHASGNISVSSIANALGIDPKTVRACLKSLKDERIKEIILEKIKFT